MITLRTLGQITLRDVDGNDIDAIARQPKRLALLAYLTSPVVGTWHRRDVVIGVFWPELDASGARAALRNALHALRQALGEDVIVGRGAEEVRIDPERLTSDTSTLAQLVAQGRHREAVATCGGEYLPGLFIKQGAEFERWLDAERQRWRGAAGAAARASIADAAGRAVPAEVDACCRDAVRLAPLDESLLQHAMDAWTSIGDRANALRAYEEFRQRLAAELQATPAPETEQRAAALRADAPARRPVTSEVQQVDAVGRSGDEPRVTSVPPANAEARDRRRSPRALLGTAVVLVAIVAAIGGWWFRTRGPDEVPAQVVVVLPPSVGSDSTLAYLATGMANETATRLSRISSRTTFRSAARAEWHASLTDDPQSIGRRLGATHVVIGALARRSDSLAFTADVVDVATGERHPAPSVTFVPGELPRATQELTASLAGALFRRDLPIPRDPSVDAESFRLTLEGWHLQTRRQWRRSLAAFTEATERDPNNASAWSGLGSAWASLAVSYAVPWEEGMDRGEQANRRALALDSLQAPAIAGLGIYRALRQRSLAAGESLVTRALQLEPGDALTYLTQQALYRHAWEWDKARDGMRIARAMDPLNVYFVDRAALVELCAARPADALRHYQDALLLDPDRRDTHLGIARSLAMLGRWNEATAHLQRLAAASGDSVLLAAGAGATGEGGYWRMMEADGRRKLDRLRRTSDWIAPSQEAMYLVGAGDLEGGLARLEAQAKAGEVGLTRLPCFAEVDRIRGWPRFRALLERLDTTK